MCVLTNLIDPISKLLGWEWLQEISIGSIVIRLLLALLFAGFIGAQRAAKRHAAGLRTYVLVCIGATIAMMTNQFLSELNNSLDTARFGAQVISGIGFLGAGTILITSRNQIRGLTTAAGLWACACMGLTIGAGFYTLALIGTLTILFALIILPYFEKLFMNKSSIYELHVELDSRPDLKLLITYLREQHIQIPSLEHNTAYSSSGLSVYTITVLLSKEAMKIYKKPHMLLDCIKELPYVNHVEIIH